MSVRLCVMLSPTVTERVPDEESLGVDRHGNQAEAARDQQSQPNSCKGRNKDILAAPSISSHHKGHIQHLKLCCLQAVITLKKKAKWS